MANKMRILINGGDTMLGRAINLCCRYQSTGDPDVTDSLPASYYLGISLHPSALATDKSIDEIGALMQMGVIFGKITWVFESRIPPSGY
jgi:hypothetical protein